MKIILFLLFTLPAIAQTPTPVPQKTVSWQGEYVGFQRITDIRRPFVNGNYAVTFLTIIGIGKKNSLQFQLICPIFAGRQTPIYRIAIDRRIF